MDVHVCTTFASWHNSNECRALQLKQRSLQSLYAKTLLAGFCYESLMSADTTNTENMGAGKLGMYNSDFDLPPNPVLAFTRSLLLLKKR